ncbi:MAG: FHA domain-containing protein [Prevotella sp.]|nr:FHA domain-containing protein [Prevotella sp.]
MRLLKIGRDASNDIVLRSERVSSLHAEITLMDSGDILLEDRGSQNGTFIQNTPIKPGKPVNIRRGDAIRFADVELQWSQVPMPEDNSAYKAIFGIGSHLNNDIQLTGDTVSRYHAAVKIGKDNKVYLIDHSKNGTTVDGQRITPNTPVRIKKSSAIVCGRVPAPKPLPIPWPSSIWKTILTAAAAILILAGIGFGAYKLIGGSQKSSDKELYARFNHAVVMLVGIYHFEVEVGDWSAAQFQQYNQVCEQIYQINKEDLRVPPQVLIDGSGKPILASGVSSQDLINAFNKQGSYGGTGFFISKDGQLITNLHVVKPWLESNMTELLQDEFSKRIAKYVDFISNYTLATSGVAGGILAPSEMSAYISKVKVKGVLDYVALIPNGMIYDPDNIIKCRVLSAGNDLNKDVALIQTINKQLPTGDCTTINVTDSMDVNDAALTVGEHIYTLGFPMLTSLQDLSAKDGIQLLARGGSITQILNEYLFGFDAASYGGASGSPIFNDKGMLVGILNSGARATQGFNYGVKAKYIKELLESPHNVE